MLLTVEGHRRIQHVLEPYGLQLTVRLDGQDVTRHCFVADDAQGYVGLYSTNIHGEPMLNTTRRDLAAHIREGLVQYVLVRADGTVVRKD